MQSNTDLPCFLLRLHNTTARAWKIKDLSFDSFWINEGMIRARGLKRWLWGSLKNDMSMRGPGVTVTNTPFIIFH